MSALLTSNRLALKEWAIVCRALGQGCQLFIARKGGILDEEGEFRIPGGEFFLFPTTLHQGKELLKPSSHLEYEIVESQAPKDGKVHLDLYAVVTDLIPLKGEGILTHLFPFHIWTDSVLKQRFEWGASTGLTLLVLRIHRLPETIRLPMKHTYGGCKSWVTLEKEIPLKSLSPVLSDSEFYRQRQRLLQAIQTVS